MLEIHKTENKKVHIKWLLYAKYYIKIYRSPGLSWPHDLSLNQFYNWNEGT